MERNPFFSVIVPVYNVEKYLEQCLESICNQRFENFELLLIDDGSPDRCPEICDKYAMKDARVRVFHKENQGLVEARKTGVCHAKGEYTIFVDSDDWIDLSMLENCHKHLKDTTVEALVLDYYLDYIQKEEVYKNYTKPGFYSERMLKKEIQEKMLYTGEYYKFGIAPSVWSKIFKTEILKKVISEIDGKITMGEDMALTYLYLANVKNDLVVDEAYYHYRYVDNSMSRSSGEVYFKKLGVMFDWIEKRLDVFDEQQVRTYQAMMLCLGIDRILTWEGTLYYAINKVKQIFKEERIRKILYSIDVEIFKGNDKEFVLALRNNTYFKLYIKYVKKRMKQKIWETYNR